MHTVLVTSPVLPCLCVIHEQAHSIIPACAPYSLSVKISFPSAFQVCTASLYFYTPSPRVCLASFLISCSALVKPASFYFVYYPSSFWVQIVRKMIDVAAQLISDLKMLVTSLEEDVAQVSSLPPSSADYSKKVRTTSELITQALLKVDSVQISKDAAADALREGDRETSRKMAVLLARRKNIVKKLSALGDQVDKLSQAATQEQDSG